MSRIVVAGALANKPGHPGEAWVKLTWVRGLLSIGFDVRFLEQLSPAVDEEAAAAWFRSVAKRFDLRERATLLDEQERTIVGCAHDELLEWAAGAVLVNVSGHLTLPRLFAAFRRRVLVDIDPGFTQFWHAEGLSAANVAGHDVFFTIGELIGSPDCLIPTSGIEWLPIRQPVVLDDWPVTDGDGAGAFTTIASWRGPFAPVEYGGRTYRIKAHEFRKFIDLPRLSNGRFEIALDIHPGDARDREALTDHGWRIVDPRVAAGGIDPFREYIAGSSAEFSVAQEIYVATRSGWFSDRTTRYLASGRPALVQDTGFSQRLPVGEGLVTFSTLDEAVAGAADIAKRYGAHRVAARQLAEEYFDARRVLVSFCERAGIS